MMYLGEDKIFAVFKIRGFKVFLYKQFPPFHIYIKNYHWIIYKLEKLKYKELIRYTKGETTMAKGELLKAVVSGILAVGILSAMGFGIISNDIRNVTDHKYIRQELNQGNSTIRQELNASNSAIKNVLMEIQVKQAVQGEILKRIEKKL